MGKEIESIFHISTNEFNIKWRLTNCCNYRCSYCIRSGKVENITNLGYDEFVVLNNTSNIARIVNENKKNTTITFVGGEVSLLDMGEIFKRLIDGCGKYLKAFNITTNGSRNAEYYNNLAKICRDNEINLSYVFSWHGQFVKLTDFMDKVEKIECHKVCEMVSTDENQNDVANFVEFCEKLGFDYKVEADVGSKNCDNLIIKTNKTMRSNYKVVYTDGSEEYFNIMRDLVRNCGDYNSAFINLENFYCSLGSNFLVVDKDKVAPVCHDANKVFTPINSYNLDKDLRICKSGCSLCGHISVSKDKDKLIAWINKNK